MNQSEPLCVANIRQIDTNMWRWPVAGGGTVAMWSERSLGHTIAEMRKGVAGRMTVTIALLRDAGILLLLYSLA
ncbi:hypothetical protein TcasGA2_TC016039 [Tribolium castaneum]|uniref:Uncharacterized protein n=1 Tax=Tribolium castaneum TaxID=7070 RepID=D7EKL4_TRICA|nr:hypothetical protein TcasGA2_TC016039 [Tribolium castaneum]